VHIYYLIGVRNRFVVLFSWAWSYLTYRRGARVITEPDVTPRADALALARGTGAQSVSRATQSRHAGA
jgi:NADH dehydrogenase